MESVITRHKALETDTEFARKVHHSSMYDVVIKQFGSWSEEEQDKWFHKSWLEKRAQEIILCDDIPCGICSIENKGDHIFINELMILPEFQNKGIGTKIVKDTIDEARKNNIPVRLQVLKENLAQNLYRRIGFKDTGATKTHFLMEIF